MQLRSEKMAAVLSRMTADENALRAAQFKEEDMKDQAETTLEVLATALLNLVHHGAFAQKDAADGKPKKTDAISKVINTMEMVAEDELEDTAENDDRSAMPVADPDIKDWAKRRRKLLPGTF